LIVGYMRRVLPLLVFALALGAAWWLWPDPAPRSERADFLVARSAAGERLPGAAVGAAAKDSPARNDSLRKGDAATSPAPRFSALWWEENFPIAAPLNAPASTIRRDLSTLSELFDAWRTNFPRQGNPVGENAEITAALAGDNPLGFALLPKDHPAISAQGELCDRWGTPFRFHQLSGERMEIRSAGPDRQFATADDALWTPP
jgi:hypothetical protein